LERGFEGRTDRLCGGEGEGPIKMQDKLVVGR